ncbi:Alkaline phosphatase, tissue-nonspecific isozyme [Lamellibrachia satsuma]|nr:Alkaline phosphatase, tissue-nonspecific isozyme [Lamellibrachia satsuma]
MTAFTINVILLLAATVLSSYDSAVNGKDQTDWNTKAQQELKDALAWKPNMNIAKNVIIFLGDGMGPSTVTAARFYMAQSQGKRIEDTALAWERFPNVALSKTYSVDRMTADSGSTGVAFLCGVKANFGVIGVNENVFRGDCSKVAGNEVDSILRKSIKAQKWTGVVTTTRVTHATPANTYAHVGERKAEAVVPDGVIEGDKCKDIASQLIDDNDDIRVVLGGGRRGFLPSDISGGRRKDRRNLIQEWLNKKKSSLTEEEYAYVSTKQELEKVDLDKVQYLLGLFHMSNMAFEVDRVHRAEVIEPSIAQMTEDAIRVLKRSGNGYFLLVEGGRIDHGHHKARALLALNDTVAFSEAVQKAMDITSEKDTLIVVTADHSHTLTMGGYPTINNPILGLVDDQPSRTPNDGKPMLTLTYSDGPGYDIHRMKNGTEVPRRNLTGVDTTGSTFVQDAGVPRHSESHGGEDVAIYARGPMSHLFYGVHEQNYIAHVMEYASCVGTNRDHCTTAAGSTSLRAGHWHVVLGTFFALFKLCLA